MELLIIVALIAVLCIAALALLNPWKQIQKSNDARRKADLSALQKAIEEWYNDKGCYPKPSDICYHPPLPTPFFTSSCGPPPQNKTFQSNICFICGSEATSPSFAPYLSKLPCDPEHPKKDYVYEVEANHISTPPCSSNRSNNLGLNPCPSWYTLLTEMSDVDTSICPGESCGFSKNELGSTPLITSSPGGYGFGFQIISGNKRKTTSPLEFWCVNTQVVPWPVCQVCANTYESCTGNPFCTSKIYVTNQNCLEHNNGH
jgi:Tfp pilus assembly protein PilE